VRIIIRLTHEERQRFCGIHNASDPASPSASALHRRPNRPPVNQHRELEANLLPRDHLVAFARRPWLGQAALPSLQRDILQVQS
jgi:hypothetical protein